MNTIHVLVARHATRIVLANVLMFAAFAATARADDPTTDTAPPSGSGESTQESTEPIAEVAASADAPVDAVSGDATSAAAADADAEVSAEEAALLAEFASGSGAEAEAVEETGLKFYGFSDMTVQRLLFPGTDNGFEEVFASRNTSFVFGNLNLYFGGNIGHGFRTLSEVRFHLAPMGRVDLGKEVVDPTTSPYTDSSASDYSDVGHQFNWGAIEIERSYIEYQAHSALTIRAGLLLTPYGVWNVDHGSPVIVPVRRPYIIGEELFPEHQTGFELYGSVDFDAGTLGYNLTLSNGRGPLDTMLDLDENKAVTSRIYFATRAVGDLQVGVSSYYGTYTDSRKRVNLGTGNLEWFNYTQYDELGLAADLRWKIGGLLVQAEFIAQQIAYTPGARPQSGAFGSAPGALTPDHTRYGAYGLVGYSIGRTNIMPFVQIDYYNAGYAAALVGSSDYVSYAGGVNWRVIPAVVLKLSGGYATFPDAPEGSLLSQGLGYFESQVAYAF